VLTVQENSLSFKADVTTHTMQCHVQHCLALFCNHGTLPAERMEGSYLVRTYNLAETVTPFDALGNHLTSLLKSAPPLFHTRSGKGGGGGATGLLVSFAFDGFFQQETTDESKLCLVATERPKTVLAVLCQVWKLKVNRQHTEPHPTGPDSQALRRATSSDRSTLYSFYDFVR
jgi:hypothetical protein